MVVGVLEGLALVTASAKAIKAALKTTEDVSQIGGLLDDMFKAKDKLRSEDHPYATKWSKFIKGKTGKDNFLQMAITETVNEKMADREMLKISILLNRKFGPDCFDYILRERDKKKKAYEDQMELERQERENFWEKALQVVVGVLVVGSAVIGMVFFIRYRMK